MNRLDLLIADLRAKQIIRKVVEEHQKKFQPQQGNQNASVNPSTQQQTQIPPNQYQR